MVVCGGTGNVDEGETRGRHCCHRRVWREVGEDVTRARGRPHRRRRRIWRDEAKARRCRGCVWRDG